MIRRLFRRSEFLRGVANAGRQLPQDIHRLRGTLRRSAIIRQYFIDHPLRRLQIGAGPNELAGWLNADFEPRRQSTIYMDATKRFPFPNDSFDFIFSEHMIEHVPFEDGLRMLSECNRVLRAGGKVRIATPNLANIAALSSRCPSEGQKRYVAWAIANHVQHSLELRKTHGYRPAYVINNFFWGFGHYFVYDAETLHDALATAGFDEIKLFNIGESDEESLSGLETHGSLIGKEFNEFETMVMQGIKR